MDLKIKPFNPDVWKLYENHGHFHDGDAGLDLYITSRQTIEPGETAFIHLQIACESAERQPFLLMPRSSISKTPLRQCNAVGLIDSGYRGELIAAVDNIKSAPYSVVPGQRLFQLVAMDGSPIHFELVESLSTTSRGAGGFGSTGH
ncbi:MAG: dUTP diphosphatase [Fidelibacterota bacterium]